MYGYAAVLVLLHDIQPCVTDEGVRCTSIGIFQHLERAIGQSLVALFPAWTYVHFDSGRFDRFRIVDLFRYANHCRDAVFQTCLEMHA